MSERVRESLVCGLAKEGHAIKGRAARQKEWHQSCKMAGCECACHKKSASPG